jgi:hypothetical protein
MAGPVPYRSDELSRERDANRSDKLPIKRGEMREVKVPNAPRDWHPIARRFWDALKSSGQADFYQDSDWAFAYTLCDDLSYYKSSTKRSGQMLQTIMSAMERLLVTEADRRRARVELHEPEDDTPDAALVVMDGYRDRLGLTEEA